MSIRHNMNFVTDPSKKIITCDENDASWVTPAVKPAITRNSRVYRKWVNRG